MLRDPDHQPKSNHAVIKKSIKICQQLLSYPANRQAPGKTHPPGQMY